MTEQVEVGVTAEEIVKELDVALDDAIEHLDALELDGLARKTGEFRNNWPVFTVTQQDHVEATKGVN